MRNFSNGNTLPFNKESSRLPRDLKQLYLDRGRVPRLLYKLATARFSTKSPSGCAQGRALACIHVLISFPTGHRRKRREFKSQFLSFWSRRTQCLRAVIPIKSSSHSPTLSTAVDPLG